MEITFWGVRGSHPVPGPDTVRYGGQTSCVEVRCSANHRVIIDAGTGLRALGKKLLHEQQDGAPRHYHIFLSHVHWDHIQGLPFFEPAYIEGTKISMYALRTAGDELKNVIGGITRHEFFPRPLENVPADFEFHEVTPGRVIRVPGFEIHPVALNHPFGAVGYRIDADGTSWAYIADTAPFHQVLHKQHFLEGPEELTAEDRAKLEAMKHDLIEVLRGTDTVVYDTMFLPEEYATKPHWGHSTPDHAIELCTGIGVRRVVLYHHAPSRTDELMDRIAETYRAVGAQANIEVVAAREQLTLEIGAGQDGSVWQGRSAGGPA